MTCRVHLTICLVGLVLCAVRSLPIDTATETTEWTTAEVTTESATEWTTTEWPSTTSSLEDEDFRTVTSADEDGTTVAWTDDERQPLSSQNIEIRWNPHQLILPDSDKSVDLMFFTDWPRIKASPVISTELPSDADLETGTTEFRPSDEPDNETFTHRVDPETPSPQSEEIVSEQSTATEADTPSSTTPQPVSSIDHPVDHQGSHISSSRFSVLSRFSLAKQREGATGRKIEGFFNFPPRILTPSSVQKENYPKIVRFNGVNRSAAFRHSVPSSPQWLYGPIKDVRKTLDNYRHTSTQKWLELSKKRPDEQQSTASELTTVTEPIPTSSTVEIATEVTQSTAPFSEPTTQSPGTTTTGTTTHLPTPEVNYATPESVYGTPEKVYGTPESVYGTPEKVYGVPEQVESTTVNAASTSDIQLVTPSTTTEPSTELPVRITTPPQGGSASETAESAVLPQFDDFEPIKEGTAKARFEVSEQHQSGKQSAPWPLDVSSEENPADHFDQQLDQAPEEGDDESQENEDMFVSDHDAHKYLVEEKTPDGYIVGEFGIVNRSSGNLRGVRYTAHGSINPQLIQDALRTFLSL